MEPANTLQQIDLLKEEGQRIRAANPEFEKVFWHKFRLEFNYNSNHLEGNTLTYGHTQLLLLFDKVGSDNYTLRELEEMKAHDVAMNLVKQAALDPEHVLTEKFIKEINEIILVRPFYKEAITPDGQPTRRLIEPGTYKKHSNSVRLENGEIFNYAAPAETPALVGDLLEWYRKESTTKELHPAQIAALFHYRLVRIHPFDDSNGRTSRLMTNYILIKNGYAPLVVDSADKPQYLTALNKADVGEIEAFVSYILKLSLQWQATYVRALKGEKIEEKGDFDKEVELLKRNLSSNPGPKVGVGADAVTAAFTHSFLPLFRSIEKKLLKFKDFFAKTYVYISSAGYGRQFENIADAEHNLEDIVRKVESGGLLKLEFVHEGFNKDGTNIFNFYAGLTIQLMAYKYSVHIDFLPGEPVEKLYDDPLKEDEIEILSNKIGKKELGEITERTRK